MSAPAAAYRIIDSRAGRQLFIADGSRLYGLPPEEALDDQALERIVADLTSAAPAHIGADPLAPPALQTLSLNVAQACNMSCGYCYADEGAFRGRARLMSSATARAAVDRLIAESLPGADLVVGFMGGEPFLARELIHETVHYAEQAVRTAGRRVRFSLTTNATLLEADDARLMSEHPFQVAFSVDGPKALNDRLRTLRVQGSAYDALLRSLALMQRFGRPSHLSARITVTPQTRDLPGTLEHVLGLGFDSAGFAAVLVAPDPALAFAAADFDALLAGMIACGERARSALLQRRRYPFSNFETALQEIGRGTHRPYPCGAGAAYLSVNADGEMFACHRLVDDPAFHFGDVASGSDRARRAEHLAARHVDRQEPCRSCWARYLCGGGCYHEVERRGRVACDYIRGWLEFCLGAYAELAQAAPGYFSSPQTYFEAAPEACR
jgi:uncharacterized protein